MLSGSINRYTATLSKDKEQVLAKQSSTHPMFDRIRDLTIIALVSDDGLMDRLVLKGGNAIRFIRPEGVRQSLDLDFSMDQDFDEPLEALRARMERLLVETFGANGLLVLDVNLNKAPPAVGIDVIGTFWGGYTLQFKVIEQAKAEQLRGQLNKQRLQAMALGPGEQRTFTVDISKHEYCAGKVARDLEGYRVYVYSAPMIVCEKIRAICQQMEAYRTIVRSSSR